MVKQGWNFAEPKEWSISPAAVHSSPNSLREYNTTTTGSNFSGVQYNLNFSNGSIAGWFYPQNTNYKMPAVWIRTAGNNDKGNYYGGSTFDSGYVLRLYVNNAYLYKYTTDASGNPVWTQLGSTMPLGNYVANTWWKLKIVANGNEITGYVWNSSSTLVATIDAVDYNIGGIPPIQSGKAGFSSNPYFTSAGPYYNYVDDVVVTVNNTKIIDPSSTSTSYTISNQNPSSTYTYQVQAKSSSGDLGLYQSQSKSTEKTQQVTVTGQASGANKATFSFSGASSYDVYYYYSATPVQIWSDISWQYDTNVTTSSVDITASNPGYISAKIVDANGTGYLWNVGVEYNPTVTISGVSVTAGAGKLTVSWSGSQIYGSDHYDIYYRAAKNASDDTGWIGPVSVTATSNTYTGLESANAYDFKVIIFNILGSTTDNYYAEQNNYNSRPAQVPSNFTLSIVPTWYG